MALLWLLLAAFRPALALVARSSFLGQSSHVSTARSTSLLCMSLRPVYDDLVGQVTSKLGLQKTDFCASYGAESWNGNGASGTAAWWAEASPQFLTGVSTLTRQNANGPLTELSLHIWMGPSYDVPHMLLTFGADAAGNYHVQSDYVPRGATVMGGDPQYLERYYGGDVQQAWTTAQEAAQAILPPAAEFNSRLLDSPVKTAVVGLDAATTESLVRGHVARFLSWLDTAQPVAARLRGGFNLRDDKLRQFYYRGQVEQQVRLLGEGLGQTVAAVNTGPTAEAYVGGGS